MTENRVLCAVQVALGGTPFDLMAADDPQDELERERYKQHAWYTPKLRQNQLPVGQITVGPEHEIFGLLLEVLHAVRRKKR